MYTITQAGRRVWVSFAPFFKCCCTDPILCAIYNTIHWAKTTTMTMAIIDHDPPTETDVSPRPLGMNEKINILGYSSWIELGP